MCLAVVSRSSAGDLSKVLMKPSWDKSDSALQV